MKNKHLRIPLDGSNTIPKISEVFWLFDYLPKATKTRLLIFILVAFVSGATALYATSQIFEIVVPVRGGELQTGIIGNPRFINPLLATSDADRDLTTLVYSGLLRTEGAENYSLDLADSYEISTDGLQYTFVLKKGAVWQDGEPVSSEDVVYTVRTALDPALKSPRRANWEGVRVEALDDRTVIFTLKKPYAPFIDNLTMGILPAHIWSQIKPENFVFSVWNNKPIGTGPYKITSIDYDAGGIPTSITLSSNNLFVLGTPFINDITVHFYQSETALMQAYKNGTIGSLSGISGEGSQELSRGATKIERLPLPRVFGVFWNGSQNVALSEKVVREALELVIDRKTLIGVALGGYAEETRSPLGKSSGEYNADSSISSSEEGLAKALSILEAGGWKQNSSGVRTKTATKQPQKTLKFTLVTGNSPELGRAAAYLSSAWQPLGAEVEIRQYEVADLNANIIRPRKFDALLFGLVSGRFPDPYAFWHSSQRLDPGLNITGYTNANVDKILDELRAESDVVARAKKYHSFESEIAKDSPALFLYSPEYLFIQDSRVKGANIVSIANPSERFNSVHSWYINTDHVWTVFAK